MACPDDHLLISEQSRLAHNHAVHLLESNRLLVHGSRRRVELTRRACAHGRGS